jgi:hypothetical protein
MDELGFTNKRIRDLYQYIVEEQMIEWGWRFAAMQKDEFSRYAGMFPLVVYSAPEMIERSKWITKLSFHTKLPYDYSVDQINTYMDQSEEFYLAFLSQLADFRNDSPYGLYDFETTRSKYFPVFSFGDHLTSGVLVDIVLSGTPYINCL